VDVQSVSAAIDVATNRGDGSGTRPEPLISQVVEPV
jgi:hypothetical protein